jgi:hypothetical protein
MDFGDGFEFAYFISLEVNDTIQDIKLFDGVFGQQFCDLSFGKCLNSEKSITQSH